MKLKTIGISVWMIYLIAVCSASDNQPDADNNETYTFLVGQTISLPCGKHNVLGKNRRLWRKDTELLTAAHVVITLDERVQITENRTLEISNASQQDTGQYICIIVHRPKPIIYKMNITVQEMTCPPPGSIEYGEVHPPLERGAQVYAFGAQIRYTCHRGYSLVGQSVRNCTLFHLGWDGEEPSCHLEDLTMVSNRLKSLETKLQPLLNTDMSAILEVEEKYSSLESRVKHLETEADFIHQTKSRAEGMDRDVHFVKRVLNLNAARLSWENVLGADIATLGVKDGHVVSEYTWIVENIEDKMAAYAHMDRFDYIESKPFYTHTPGYKMVLHLYPDYEHSKHIGLFAILVRGKFDDTVAWPFTSKYMLSIGSLDEDDSTVIDTLVPWRTPSCNFDRPEEDNTIGCGFSELVEHDTIIKKRHLHQLNGNIWVKISVFLDD